MGDMAEVFKHENNLAVMDRFLRPYMWRETNMKRKINWEMEYERSCGRMLSMLEGDMPRVMIQNEARVLLNSTYRGAWRTILKLAVYEIKSSVGRYAFRKWEWTRRRVFRRMPDPVLEIAERVMAEDQEVSRMVNEL